LFRIFQELNDFLQLFRLVDAGYIVEAHAGVGLHVDFGLAPADRQEAAAERHTKRRLHR
jgi:hypothetical protein